MDLLRPIEAEWSIVGILAGGDKRTEARGLSADCFADHSARSAFEACQVLGRNGGASLAALDEYLTRRIGAEAAPGIMQKVMKARSENSLNGWNLGEYVRIVREAADRRSLIQTAEQLARGAADETQDVEALRGRLREQLRRSNHSVGRWVTITDAVLNAYEAAEQGVKPIRTGIAELDTRMGGGLRRGELTILGARPAVGKSAVLLQMALQAAKDGKKVGFVSLEMSEQQIGARVLSAYADVSPALLTSGLDPDRMPWNRLAEGIECMGHDEVNSLRLMVHKGLTIEQLDNEIQQVHDDGECEVLFVDYAQLLSTKQPRKSDFERLGVVSRGLKALTIDLNIPIVAAAQVKRQDNHGILRAPGLDELRGSGDFEQDADNVILLHRVESNADNTLNSKSYQQRHSGLFEYTQRSNMQLLTLEVAKQRQGCTGRTWTMFRPERMQFINPNPVSEEVKECC